MRAGIANADSIPELEQRLHETPSDLDGYYKAMLDSIDPFYQADASRMLLCCMVAPDLLPLGVVSLLDHRHKLVLKEERHTGALLEFDSYSDMQRRLSARCLDLLEICDIYDKSIYTEVWTSPLRIGPPSPNEQAYNII